MSVISTIDGQLKFKNFFDLLEANYNLMLENKVLILNDPKGYFFFFPTRKLFNLKNLKTLKKELEYANHDFFIKQRDLPVERRVNTYIKALRRLGIDGLMVYR